MMAGVSLSANSSATTATLSAFLGFFVTVNETSSELRGLLLDSRAETGGQETSLEVLVGDVMVTGRQGLELQVQVDVIPELVLSVYAAFGGSTGQCSVIDAASNPLPGIDEPVEVCVRAVDPVPTTASPATTPDSKGSADAGQSGSNAGVVAGVVVAMLVIVVLVGVAWQRRRQARVKVDTGPTVIMQDNPLYAGKQQCH